MDELDRSILNALRLDARKPFLELAKELGVADATIHIRVRKMIEEGAIRRFETVVDAEKLGFGITAFVEIKVNPGATVQAASKLSQIDGVLEAHEIHGHCDILLKVRVRNLVELRDKLVGEVRAIKEVVSSEAYPVLKVVKEEYSVPVTAQQRASR